MALSFVDFYGCCTAKILVGLGNSSNAVNDRDLKLMLDQAAKMPKYKDFSVFVATTTAVQKTGEAFLEKVGFTKGTTGTKETRAAARHKETGGITVWSIDVDKWNEWQDNYEQEGKVLVISPMQVKARQAAWPELTIPLLHEKMADIRTGTSSYKLGENTGFTYYRTYAAPEAALQGMTTSPTRLIEVIKEFFGFVPPNAAAGTTLGAIMSAQKDWRNGFTA